MVSRSNMVTGGSSGLDIVSTTFEEYWGLSRYLWVDLNSQSPLTALFHEKVPHNLYVSELLKYKAFYSWGLCSF